jgi:hypothetical protein
MDNVFSLSGYSFDFGKAPITKATNPSAAAQESQITTQTESFQGY